MIRGKKLWDTWDSGTFGTHGTRGTVMVTVNERNDLAVLGKFRR